MSRSNTLTFDITLKGGRFAQDLLETFRYRPIISVSPYYSASPSSKIYKRRGAIAVINHTYKEAHFIGEQEVDEARLHFIGTQEDLLEVVRRLQRHLEGKELKKHLGVFGEQDLERLAEYFGAPRRQWKKITDRHFAEDD